MKLSNHPRPDFQRKEWISLSGTWSFQFDDLDIGIKDKWYLRNKLDDAINVPFAYQTEKSGINVTAVHEIMWYQKSIAVEEIKGKEVYLNFNAVDYSALVWVNGEYQGRHDGGYTPFSFCVTEALDDGKLNVVVRVEDKSDASQPRGKQYWGEKGNRCWYTPSSGIWQTVYIEYRAPLHFEYLHAIPCIDNGTLTINYGLNKRPGEGEKLTLSVHLEEKSVNSINVPVKETEGTVVLKIKERDYVDETLFWSPDNPVLFSLYASLESGENVCTYFGMRKISVENGRVLLNNRYFYQRLVLDQGYWEKSLLTPPDEEGIIKDIELIKSMGFNGVRMHQKIEDPRFYYWADRLGLVVWGELPSAYEFTPNEKERLQRDMKEFINRDFNHPSIICWVPLNESWGVRNIYSNTSQINFALLMYHLVKALDPTRLCDTNDGWEQVESDICGVHDYTENGKDFKEKWKNTEVVLSSSAGERMIYATGFKHVDEPVFISEFGGVAFSCDVNDENWGYRKSEEDEESFLKRLKSLVSAIREKDDISGFCYTQFTDVIQEVNGLLKIDREPKCSVEKIREIFSS